jgi:hypothetical protein
MGTGTRLVDRYKLEFLYEGTASGGITTLWLNMNLYSHITWLIQAANGTGVTGAAITLNQANTVSGTGSKALNYNTYFSAVAGFASQAATADAMTATTGVSGTFTTATTASTNLLYAIEVQDTDLDLSTTSDYFNCVQLAIATGSVNVTWMVLALCYPRFGGKLDAFPSPLI